MKYLRKFNESNLEELENEVKGLTTYLSDRYYVNVIIQSFAGKFTGLYVGVENEHESNSTGDVFKTDDEIKDMFDTIVDLVKLRLDSELNIGYYFNNSNTHVSYLSEDFRHDEYTSVELVIEDKKEGPYFNNYFKL